MSNNHENTEVHWGGERFREQYIDLLTHKYINGWILALTLGTGILGFIRHAFHYGPSWPVAIGLAVWVVGVLALALRQSYIHGQLTRIERFFDFYERRHAVRHALYCLWWPHCAALHGLHGGKA